MRLERMSWFDSIGIANLAKTALKEAQKQIDKALDIKEDEVVVTDTVLESIKSGSKTEPCTPLSSENLIVGGQLKHMDSIWGSFTGSFFEHPVTGSGTTVTKPPSSLKRKSFEDSGIEEIQKDSSKSSRHSVNSNENSSESIELLSPPTTPGSALTSPSQNSASTLQDSESVEIIRILDTPTSASSPNSITTIDTTQSSEELNNFNYVSTELTPDDDDISIEEDSISYTISEQPITVMEPADNTPITTAPSRSSLHLSFEKTTLMSFTPEEKEKLTKMSFSEGSICDTEGSNDSEHTLTSLDKICRQSDDVLDKSYENVEIQTEISDSTHSFEEILDPTVTQHDDLSPTNGDSETSKFQILEQTSGHTSGDEIETATSSDIEIISSPNGDSSSTNSGAYRASPLKIHDGKSNIDLIMIKKRGHNRELSEISMQSNASDDSHLSNHSDSEKLMRRINELSEILEQREYRLVELGRQNAELHELNSNIMAQLELKQKRNDTAEISNVTDEYTQRLSALEKKFQQSIRERESLRQQFDNLKLESQNKISKADVEKIIVDKDFLIEELKQEGEKLSKQVLQHSTIIKKLRVKEKENDSQGKKQRDEISELNEETDRLKRSLSAKEEVERSQIDAVHKLSSERRKLEKENAQLKSQLDDNTQKLDTLKRSFEAAKKELTENNETHFELVKKSNLLANLESENEKLQTHNGQIEIHLNDLMEKLKMSEIEYAARLQKIKQENCNLLRRTEESEMRAEEEKNAAASVTIPLMKRLEVLQTTLRNKEREWEHQERSISNKLDESSEIVKSFSENEKKLKDQIFNLNSRISNLEDRLTAALFKSEDLINNLQQKQIEYELLEADYKMKIKSLEKDGENSKQTSSASTSRITELEDKLKHQTEQLEYVQRQHQIKVEHMTAENLNEAGLLNDSRELSPTLSVGNVSFPDSLASIAWNNMDDVDFMSNSGRPSLGNTGGLHTTSMLETLQATLKQRDGEVYQLQWEQSRFQTERNILTAEISNLTVELENIKEKVDKTLKLEEQFGELQKQYDALLQMYGEKVEETQELQLDLQDVKEMYKLQIDELLLQQKHGNL